VLRAALPVLLSAAGALAQPAPPPAAPGNALTLERAIQLALERNYDLRRTEYLASSADQDVTIARAQMLPTLDFNASRSRTRVGAGNVTVTPGFQAESAAVQIVQGYSARLQLQQVVFAGGKRWYGYQAAELSRDSAEANVDEQRLTTVFTVEQRFYELVRQQRQLRVLGDAAQRSRDQAEFTQRLFEGGRATQADVYAARANRDNDEINRLGQEARVEVARQDLAVSVGLDPVELLTIAEPPQMQQEPAQPPPVQDAVQKALAQRPGLKAFALAAESQRKNVAAARGDYWPLIAVGASYGRNNTDLATFDDPNLGLNSQVAVSVTLNWNLFAGFSTQASVEKARIGVLQAENDLQNGRRNVASDVERAVAQLQVARQQARIAAQTVQTSSENLRLARTRQQVGVGTQLEVRDAELRLTQSELARANALVDGHEAESALRRATGG
jgi:outer membrane protein